VLLHPVLMGALVLGGEGGPRCAPRELL
jgi:hypothetical protein